MNKMRTKTLLVPNDRSNIATPVAWLAILATLTVILLLVALHILSPEFSPSWRMISECAFGHYAWVLSLMFLSWGVGSWALVVALWSEIQTKAGRMGLWLLIVAGLGEAMASYFDIGHEIGHGIAGLHGVLGFPIAALLLSSALSRNELCGAMRKPLLWIANLSWVNVILLIATLATITMQMVRTNGGHFPQHAPKSLPPGVLAVDGWPDRMIVLTNCGWVLFAAWHAICLHRDNPRTSAKLSNSCPSLATAGRASGQWVKSCSILTTTLDAMTSAAYDRMPVILGRDDYEWWLDPGMTSVDNGFPVLLHISRCRTFQ